VRNQDDKVCAYCQASLVDIPETPWTFSGTCGPACFLNYLIANQAILTADKALGELAIRELQSPKSTSILVVSASYPGTWGRAKTLEEAIKIAEKPRYYHAFVVADDTIVTGIGNFQFPAGCPPHEIFSKLPKKKKAKPHGQEENTD
jgi:hypothetical protein